MSVPGLVSRVLPSLTPDDLALPDEVEPEPASADATDEQLVQEGG